jgi:hypothetical protein
MFFLDGLDECEIWSIGDFAGQGRGKPAIASATMRSSLIQEIGFEIRPAPRDHPLHVNVGPWPSSKDEQLALAQELCANSTLNIRPAELSIPI